MPWLVVHQPSAAISMNFRLLALYLLLLPIAVFLAAGPNFLQVMFGLKAAGSLVANLVLLGLGMLLITHGGDLFTDSAVDVARVTRVPPVIIGATIVSMATTFPEFMVSLTGTLRGHPDFAVGNALGSCCCNIGLIIGSCALINGYLAPRRGTQTGIPASRLTLRGPGAFMLVAGVAVWAFSLFDNAGLVDENGNTVPFAIARWQAGVLVVLLVAYLGYSLRTALQARFAEVTRTEAEADQEAERRIIQIVVLFAVGAGLVVVGSKLLVENSVQIAFAMGVPKLIVGLTVLAIGTSLPEFTISLLAVLKGHGALGIGNIIGANVLNICWVVATCALIKPLPIQWQTVVLDGPVVLLMMTLLIGLAWKNERFSMRSGAVLITVYALYYVFMFAFFGGQP
jgi:cation:H+ antiporter